MILEETIQISAHIKHSLRMLMGKEKKKKKKESVSGQHEHMM